MIKQYVTTHMQVLVCLHQGMTDISALLNSVFRRLVHEICFELVMFLV